MFIAKNKEKRKDKKSPAFHSLKITSVIILLFSLPILSGFAA
jgi:hypothetical protein